MNNREAALQTPTPVAGRVYVVNLHHGKFGAFRRSLVLRQHHDSRPRSSTTATMSYMLPHLHTGWHVDQAIMSEDDRLVVIRFGRDYDQDCMKQDEVLFKIAEACKNFAVFYLVDIDEVPDFNKMYELYDPVTVMFFFRNKHMMIDLGTGNNNKINWALEDKQEMIDIIETVYRGAKKGRGLVISPKDYSTKYKY
jgi:U5 snRNP protein, DIM1 family